MDDLVALVIVIAFGIFLLLKRNVLRVQGLFPLFYIVSYSSRFGLSLMRRFASFPFVGFFGYLGVLVGFTGMILIGAELVFGTFDALFKGANPSVQLVLPIDVQGAFFVPPLYLLLSIFMIAVVHEFSHGVLSYKQGVPVRSSGFAFLSFIVPIVPAAFVEPDESALKRRSLLSQLSVFSAGPFSNILFSAFMLGILFLSAPVLDAAFDYSDVKVVGFARESPATGSGLEKGDVIEGLGPVRVISFDDLNRALSEREPGEEVILRVDGREVPVILGEDPSNPGRAYLGLNLAQDFVVDEGFVRSWGSLMPYALKWLSGFAYWLFVLNLAIGLFNLVPIGPLDGGKMFYVACLRFLSEDRARTASLCVGLFYLSLIVINIAIGFI